MPEMITLGPASLRLNVPYLRLVNFVKGRTDLPGVGKVGRFNIVDVSRLEDLRQVLRGEGLIQDAAAEQLVPAGAGAESL